MMQSSMNERGWPRWLAGLPQGLARTKWMPPPGIAHPTCVNEGI
jgi:hypothetical protein